MSKLSRMLVNRVVLLAVVVLCCSFTTKANAAEVISSGKCGDICIPPSNFQMQANRSIYPCSFSTNSPSCYPSLKGLYPNYTVKKQKIKYCVSAAYFFTCYIGMILPIVLDILAEKYYNDRQNCLHVEVKCVRCERETKKQEVKR